MKKIIAVLLTLTLMLAFASGLAEEAEKQTFGIIRVNGEFTLKGLIPEGYKIVPFEMDDDAIFSRILSDDPTRPEMILSIAYDETYADVDRMNDLDDEALAILEKTFIDTDPVVNITYDETSYGTRLMVCRTQTDSYDYLNILSIYKGYFVEFAMTPGKEAPEQQLTDEEIESCNAFLSELDFVPGAQIAEVVINGKTFDAKITGFDADAKTIDVTLLTPLLLTEWEVVSINEGDTIRIGTEDVEIGTLKYEGDDAIINDEYYLQINEDRLYTATDYEFPILTEVKAMTAELPDNVTFAENIDPEYGDPLDETKLLAIDDLLQALKDAQEGGVGFDSQNVRITFDENGAITQVERYYAPWQ